MISKIGTEEGNKKLIDYIENSIWKELATVSSKGYIFSTVALSNICIDHLAGVEFDTLIGNKEKFSAWVNKYMKPLDSIYEGIQIYSARCAYLHELGANSDLSRKQNALPVLYVFDLKNIHKKTDEVMYLDIKKFAADVRLGMLSFLKELPKNDILREKFEISLEKFLITMKLN
jgi:hypothetical protein